MTRSTRYIKATATCEAFPLEFHGGSNYTVNVNGTIQYPPMSMNNGTVYISVEDLNNPESRVVTCGPRCGHLRVIQIEVDELWTFREGWFYVCESTVHEVEGAVIPEEQIGDPMAVIAATSLSLSGSFSDFGRLFGFYFEE